jgi:hypothetical protein
MSLPQNAENVKKAIESIINGYNFNKIKIFADVCDEGSNLLRLFQNNATMFYDCCKIIYIKMNVNFTPKVGVEVGVGVSNTPK